MMHHPERHSWGLDCPNPGSKGFAAPAHLGATATEVG